jgi:hypothetical protein
MIHHVYACRSNIGDWLSARAIQSLVAPEPFVEHLCDEPFVPGTLARLERRDPDDLVVVGGGGLFMDYFTPFWESLLRMEPFPRLAIWGVGYCDIKASASRASTPMLRDVVERAELCVVRDTLTRDYLGSSLVGEPVPCPAMVVVPKGGTKEPSLLHVLDYAVVGEKGYQAVADVTRAHAERTSRRYTEIDNQFEPPTEEGLARMVALYEHSDLVVSSRLHGCIIGLAAGCRVLAISGDRKVDAFMEAVGLRDWIVDLERLEHLEGYLDRLEYQPSAAAFVHDAIAANTQIGAVIRELARGERPTPLRAAEPLPIAR